MSTKKLTLSAPRILKLKVKVENPPPENSVQNTSVLRSSTIRSTVQNKNIQINRRRCKGCTIERDESELIWYIPKHIKVTETDAIPTRAGELENIDKYKRPCYCSEGCAALRIRAKYSGTEEMRYMNYLRILKKKITGNDTDILCSPNPMKLNFYRENGLSVEEYDQLRCSTGYDETVC